MLCLFLSFHHGDSAAQLALDDLARIRQMIAATPGATRAIVMTPALAQDRYHAAVPAPMLAAQVYFETIAAAETAIGADGALTGITAETFPSLSGAEGRHQLMLTRSFPVPPENGKPDVQSCAFMVHYPGAPEDLNAWLGHYIAHHPPIMATFPGIREIEIYTRVDWIDAAPWPRASHFQRNKVVFDSPQALEAALNSPARDRMKDDFATFPPFTGGSVHVPMIGESIIG